MLRNKIYSWALKLWIIATIGFLLFCLGRVFNHFPKHETPAKKSDYLSMPDHANFEFEVEVYEAVKTAGNSYERIRRAQ